MEEKRPLVPNVVQEQPLLSPRLQVAESRAFIPVDTSSVSPTAREEQRSDKNGESDDAQSTDQEAFVKSDVEEEEVDETMESVSVTVTEYSEEEEREGDEEENEEEREEVRQKTLCLRSLYLKKVSLSQDTLSECTSDCVPPMWCISNSPQFELGHTGHENSVHWVHCRWYCLVNVCSAAIQLNMKVDIEQ